MFGRYQQPGGDGDDDEAPPSGLLDVAPLMANCCVKFVAPLTSVIVPAARSSNELKSRPFSGNSLADWLDSFSPPVASPHSRLYSDWDSEPPVSAPRIQW